LAADGVSSLLALEVAPPWGPAQYPPRADHTHSQNVASQSCLGMHPHPRRVGQAWHRCLRVHNPKVSSQASSLRPDVEDVPSESRQGFGRRGFLLDRDHSHARFNHPTKATLSNCHWSVASITATRARRHDPKSGRLPPLSFTIAVTGCSVRFVTPNDSQMPTSWVAAAHHRLRSAPPP